MINEFNIIYDKNNDKYVLFTTQHDPSRERHNGFIYQNRIEMDEVSEEPFLEKINQLKMREAYLTSNAMKGYEFLDDDLLICLSQTIKQRAPDLELIIKDFKGHTTQPQDYQQ